MADSTDNWAPHVTVATVVEQDGRYLLVEELNDAGETVFNQPAGHIEKNETLIEGAMREMLEETGYEVRITGFLGVYVYTPPTSHLTYYRMAFSGEVVKYHADRPLDTGIIAPRWLTLDEIVAETRLRSPLVRRCVEDFRAGRIMPLATVFEVHAQHGSTHHSNTVQHDNTSGVR